MLCFDRNRSCSQCELHHSAQSICIPSRPYRVSNPPKPVALFVIGEAPGADEDQSDTCFVGRSGKVLSTLYMDHFRFPELADVYFGNAVRCRPPSNSTPTASHVKRCYSYLDADIRALSAAYSRLHLLCVGATACRAVFGSSLSAALSHQGDTVRISGCEVRTWVTYHPAYLLRLPSMSPVVQSHLQRVQDAMLGKEAHSLVSVKPEQGMVVPSNATLVSVDIETYGCLQGQTQTQFHPHKSVIIDRTMPNRMIATVSLAWEDSGQIRTSIYCPQDPPELMTLIRSFENIVRGGALLIGHNLPFDISYLRYVYPQLVPWLDRCKMLDTSILNYLLCDSRPEKSLKKLAPLFGITEYDQLGCVSRYKSPADSDLWAYNCKDSAATLLLFKELDRALAASYRRKNSEPGGIQSLSPYQVQWFSDLLKLVIRLNATGVYLDWRRLKRIDERYRSRVARLEDFARSRYNFPLSGKGSGTAATRLLNQAEELLELGPSVDLKLTGKRHQISTSDENREALLSVLPRNWAGGRWLRDRLSLMGDHARCSKIVSSYLNPLLVDAEGKGTRLINGVTYPRWYPVPSEWDEGEGGTKQARIVCKGPGVQTFPPVIKSCITSRFGCSMWIDYSQVELRVAALLSGDPVMLGEFERGEKLHDKTAVLIFGPEIVDHPKYHDVYRQAGKTLNFLVLFKGQARKFQATLHRDVGLDYPLPKCAAAIRAHATKYRRLVSWQDDLINEAVRTGFVTLPLTGHRRHFPGGRAGVSLLINEVVNFPVQTVAANIMLSAHVTLMDSFHKAGLRAIASVNIYDAVFVEYPTTESDEVHGVVSRVMPNPPYFRDLCSYLGRTVPLTYEIKEH